MQGRFKYLSIKQELQTDMKKENINFPHLKKETCKIILETTVFLLREIIRYRDSKSPPTIAMR